MSTRAERKKRANRSLHRHCLNCGKEGPHYIGPSFGDPGMWTCDQKSTKEARS